MKVLVAYQSQTGNTRKVAEAIFGEIPHQKEIKRVQDVRTLDGYDLAFLGFPIHGEGPDKKTTRYLEQLCTPGKNIALFITHAAPEGEATELEQWLDKFRQAAGAANVIATFDCQGELARAIKLFMSIYPNAKYRMWARMDNSHGQPDETRLTRAREFAREVTAQLTRAAPEVPDQELATV